MSKNDIVVIGIGASAGGLEALQAFIQNLPASSNMAYIIAQHLSPTYKSLMVELLAKGTELEVLAATDGLIIKANTIYVCPPNENIFVEDDIILLSKPRSNIHGPKPSVDLFFESLAENKKEKSVGIILSGTGSDGSRGVRAIKASGGFTIVQDPQTAKYDGMPNSAINTGTIDLVLTADKMGPELTEILSYVGKSIIPKSGSSSTNVYKNILNKIKDVKGVDFNLYKPSTIERRIERRMVALKIVTLNDYHDFLVQNSGEPEALFKDILIGVTSFFRDGDSFSVLKNQLEEYLKTKENRTIRIWAPGCSTGEEAYSLSMMISEILGSNIGRYKVQIFATDIDENALQYARKGLYQESALVGLDKSLRNKYFTIKSEHYEVVKPIREMVIFSRHNILRDPAFLRLDMIVCRNLLIYFSQELQKKLFPEFHYALNDNALLFLGKSESVGHFQGHFKTMDKKWKIYQSNFLGRKEPPPTPQHYEKVDLINSKKIISEVKKPGINDIVTDYVNEYIIPMCVVINDNMDIVYVKGKNPYLIRPDGEQSQNIFKNINAALSIELRAALHDSAKRKSMVKSNFQKVILLDEVIRYVRVTVVPMSEKSRGGLSLVCFQEEDSENFKSFDTKIINDGSSNNKELEFELAKAKEYLQTVVEELETSNEEMQSLNEELQSSNEELQSSNEELETTNEELQSTNEELQTAYTELRTIYDDKETTANEILLLNKKYEKSNRRLETAIKGAKLGLFDYHVPILQEDLWSEEWASMLGYQLGELPQDKTHMLEWIDKRVHPDEFLNFKKTNQDYLDGKVDSYRLRLRLRHKDGRWLWIEKYANAVVRDEIGRVLRSIGATRDVTEEVTWHASLKESAQRLSLATESANIGLWEMNSFEKGVSWDERSYEIFEVEPGTEVTFEFLKTLIHPQDLDMIYKDVDFAIAQKRLHNSMVRIVKPGAKIIYVQCSGNPILNENGVFEKMVGTYMDITDHIVKNRKNYPGMF